MSFFGLLNLPWWGYVIYTLILTHITMASVTIFLHRCQAHRALKLHPIMSHFFRFWLYLTTGMKTIEWVAIHRKHHATSDKEDDPHSPVVYGIKTLLLEGADLYRVAKREPGILEKYGRNTPDDWMEKYVYGSAFLKGKLGIFIMLAINLVLLGVPGIIVWAVQMAWTPFFAAGIINGLAHFWGYRNYECADTSTNISPWGILIAGEELHNNHHAYGTSAKFSVKPWEFDIGWCYIRMMQSVGLAKVLRLPPQEVIMANKVEVDLDTVKGIVSNRLQILAKYSRMVVKPVCRHQERLAANVGKLLCREPGRINLQEQQTIDSALQQSPELKTVCQFREKLQAIWNRTTASHKELIEALQEWCKQAEQSGIAALQDFAAYVRNYTVRPAVNS